MVSFHPLNRIVAGLLLVLSLPALMAEALDGTSSWRQLSRQARIAYADKQYDKSIKLYREAVQSLEKENRQAEAIFDLELNLADVYRASGQLASCRRLMDGLEPNFGSPAARVFDDPLLPERYWKRRADLALALNDAGQAAACSQKVCDILHKHFEPKSSCYLDHWAKTQNLLMRTGNFLQVAEDIKTLKAECGRAASSKSPDARKLGTIAFVYTCTSADCRAHIDTLLRKQRPGEAIPILRVLSQCDDESNHLLELWKSCMFQCAAAGHFSKITESSNFIETVVSAADQAPFAEKLEVVCLLATASSQCQDISEQKRWHAVYELLSQKKDALSAHELSYYCASTTKLARSLAASKNFDQARTLLKNAVSRTENAPALRTTQDLIDYALAYTRCRYRLACIERDAGNLDLASDLVLQLDKSQVRVASMQQPVLALHKELAASLRSTGKDEKAELHSRAEAELLRDGSLRGDAHSDKRGSSAKS